MSEPRPRRAALHEVLALACAATIVSTGCDGILVELGRGQIGPVLVDRTFPTGITAYEGCPSIALPYSGSAASGGEIVVAPLSQGCLLSVRVDGAVLLGRSTMALWADQLAAYDLSALIAIDVIIDEMVVDGGPSARLGADEVAALSIALDERVLFDRDDLVAMGDDEEIRVAVPQSLVDRFTSSLDERTSFTGRLDVRLVLGPGVPIPRLLHVRTLLQPVLLVDGLEATF